MIRFLDGPAAGKSLVLRRAPLFLRVVQAPGGRLDALDQLSDEPQAGERVYVYVKAEDRGHVHLLMSPRSASGWYAMADYRLHAEQPTDNEARDTERWRAWAMAQRDKERAKHETV